MAVHHVGLPLGDGPRHVTNRVPVPQSDLALHRNAANAKIETIGDGAQLDVGKRVLSGFGANDTYAMSAAGLPLGEIDHVAE